jgi:phosphoketolase
LLSEHFPDLKIRYINVVDLFTMQSSNEHPHGLSDRDFDSLFTVDKPKVAGAHIKERMQDMQIECRNYARERGVDVSEVSNWGWPY